MREIAAILASMLCLAGCANSTTDSNRRIIAFYRQAVQRMKFPESKQLVDWQGLTLSDGGLPGCPRFPSADESSIVVSDPDPKERLAVQVIVWPRVSGSFLDPAEPSPEFLREQAAATEKALRMHRYTGVFLLSKSPLEKPASGGNGGQRP